MWRGTVFVIAVLAAAGCFETGTEGADATVGGDGSGDTSSPGTGDCKSFCAMAKANLQQCEMNLDQCEANCVQQQAEADAKGGPCKEMNDAYISCAVSKGLHCQDYVVDYMPCRHERDHVYNYCAAGQSPDTPCSRVAMFDVACPGGTPQAWSCMGNVPAGCVVGGTNNNSNLYCCP